MTLLNRVWKDQRLTLTAKLRLYQALYWYTQQKPGTLLAADCGHESVRDFPREMPATYTRYSLAPFRQQHRRPGAYMLPWWSNMLPWCKRGLSDIQAARRISVFGHIAWLENDVPVHVALRWHVDLSDGVTVVHGREWKRRPGRPRARWIDQVRQDSNTSPVELWRHAVRRGHGAGATQQPSPRLRDHHDDDDGCVCVVSDKADVLFQWFSLSMSFSSNSGKD